MADTTRAEIAFSTHDSAFSLLLSPVPMRGYLALRRDWATPGTLEDVEAAVDRFCAISDASCECGQPIAEHDLVTVRAMVGFWLERVWEVEPPLPVESSARTASAGDSSPTAPRSPRRRSSPTRA